MVGNGRRVPVLRFALSEVMNSILVPPAKATGAGTTTVSVHRRQPSLLEVVLGLRLWRQRSDSDGHGAIRPAECDGRSWERDESTQRDFLGVRSGLLIDVFHRAEAAIQIVRIGLSLGLQIFMIRMSQALSVMLESADLHRVLAGISRTFERLYGQGLNIWFLFVWVRFCVFLTIDRLGVFPANPDRRPTPFFSRAVESFIHFPWQTDASISHRRIPCLVAICSVKVVRNSSPATDHLAYRSSTTSKSTVPRRRSNCPLSWAFWPISLASPRKIFRRCRIAGSWRSTSTTLTSE